MEEALIDFFKALISLSHQFLQVTFSPQNLGEEKGSVVFQSIQQFGIMART